MSVQIAATVTHATCSNTVGSFTCQCNNGFTGNGLRYVGRNFLNYS